MISAHSFSVRLSHRHKCSSWLTHLRVPTHPESLYDEQEPCEAERDEFTDSDGSLHMQAVLISYNKKYKPKLVSPLVGFSIVGRVLN